MLPHLILFFIFIHILLATIFLVPALRLKMFAPYRKAQKKADKCNATKDTKSDSLAFGFYMRRQ